MKSIAAAMMPTSYPNVAAVKEETVAAKITARQAAALLSAREAGSSSRLATREAGAVAVAGAVADEERRTASAASALEPRASGAIGGSPELSAPKLPYVLLNPKTLS